MIFTFSKDNSLENWILFIFFNSLPIFFRTDALFWKFKNGKIRYNIVLLGMFFLFFFRYLIF